MRAVLPGKPQARLQGISAGLWEGNQIIVYISGNALVILDGPDHILQTTYNDDEEELSAVAFDEITGKIACSGTKLHVYKPYGQDEGAVKWSLQCSLEFPDGHDGRTTLSWGHDEELLVGGTALSLYATYNGGELLATKRVASPLKFALLSPDASLVASTGIYDRLVKVWRRISYGSAEQRFDHAYLPHPTAVTGLHWRRPFHREQNLANVLYTICADNKLRIWTPGDAHGSQIMQLWGEIDLVESIQTRALAGATRNPVRYVFVIDSREFAVATEKAVQQASNTEDEQDALAHLIEVANRNPEVCVVLDNYGNMSAWGLENVGCKQRKATDIFNIAHAEGLQLHLDVPHGGQPEHVQFYSFCQDRDGSSFTLLQHHFNDRIDWVEGRLDRLFDLAKRKGRLQLKTTWTGHSRPVKKIIRTGSGRAAVSCTEDNRVIMWTQKIASSAFTLIKQSAVEVDEHIHRMLPLRRGQFTVLLHHQEISLWDTRGAQATEVARCKYRMSGKPLCLIFVPETVESSPITHVATISSNLSGIAWEIRLPTEEDGINGHVQEPSMTQFTTFKLGSGGDVAYVLAVDPAGTHPVVSGFLDIFARDVAISWSVSGTLKSWTASVNAEQHSIEWLLTSTVETGIQNPSLGSATSIRKAAMVDSDKTGLTIWDTKSALLEHEEHFVGHGEVHDLDWSSTPDNQSILAVGFPHRVVVYTQLRFNYLDAGPSWAPVKEVRIRDLTAHPIGDSVWLSKGHLVIGAGNQLFIQDNRVDPLEGVLSDLRFTAQQRKDGMDIFTAVRRLNGPLPIFHPQLLGQAILAGKMQFVQRILVSFYKKFKFYTDGDELDDSLGFPVESFSEELQSTFNVTKKEMHSSYADFSDEEEPETVTEEVAASINELLTRCNVPQLSSREQFHLADIVECVGTVEKHRRSIDENATRFMLFLRQHFLRHAEENPNKANISLREITWAYHSGSQDILVDIVSRHYHSRMLWVHARETGMFMWMTDLEALRAQFEAIGRNEYTKSDDRNPVDCSLYYLALKKKTVLIGLWRMATWSREQGATQKLLSNNFKEPRWRTAALKNAYALMGKRRFEYAAAFFLLAESLKDAVSVISNQMQDMQLAIAVARVYEGDNGPVLTDYLENTVLPRAVIDGNRWLATWAFWMLGKRDRAVRALVTPLSSLVTPPQSPSLQSKLFLADDPALVVLYKQLREKSLQTLKGALAVPPKAEWDFVIHTARLYTRMGCDVLALDLVRTWEFLAPPPVARIPPLPTKFPQHAMQSPTLHSPTLHTHPSALDDFSFDARKLLRRRSSLVVADLPQRDALKAALTDESKQEEKANGSAEGKGEAEKKPPPTQLKEDTSLLDAFGF